MRERSNLVVVALLPRDMYVCVHVLAVTLPPSLAVDSTRFTSALHN